MKHFQGTENSNLLTIRVMSTNNGHDQRLINNIIHDSTNEFDPLGSLGVNGIINLCSVKQKSLSAGQCSVSIGVYEDERDGLLCFCPSVIVYVTPLGKQAIIDIPGVIRNGVIVKSGLNPESHNHYLSKIIDFLYEEMHIVFVEMRLGCRLNRQLHSMIKQQPSFIMDLRCENHWVLQLNGAISFDEYLQNSPKNIRRRAIKKRKKSIQSGVTTKILRGAELEGYLGEIHNLNDKFHETKTAAKVGKHILDFFGAPGIQDKNILDSVCKESSELNNFCVASFCNDEMIAFMTFFHGEDVTHAMYTGKDLERCNRTLAYFALLYAAIDESARLGVKYIDFYATTGTVKKELGCEPAGDMHWVMFSKSLPHWFLWKVIGCFLHPLLRFLEQRSIFSSDVNTVNNFWRRVVGVWLFLVYTWQSFLSEVKSYLTKPMAISDLNYVARNN